MLNHYNINSRIIISLFATFIKKPHLKTKMIYVCHDLQRFNDVKKYGFPIILKAFKKIIREEKPDLIHIEMSESLITYGFIRHFFKNILIQFYCLI